ncbi:hypothetical protein J2S43_001457 [Catenuloplanes nepalensis]|uniref:MobA/VirD2-like nuclease domain-containing protein n=1 Tax=Catenuloplanes nepalensis TaxID=587533 RepID=A0ABT9MNE6_9ACTN|nr:relaxase [Catenuloplanes nepalensis]MDP9792945.1 hypothetical protein [Catenuloplanes nepalensis]
MIPNIVRGKRIGGLLRYLYGPGRREEHVDPRLVAAWDGAGPLAALEPAVGRDGRRDFRALAEVLEQPVRSGRNPPAKPVWHCSLRTHPSDRQLSDAQWGRIAAEAMAQIGLAPHQDVDAVRWVAVRHGADHIHIVATLVRQDRRTEWARNDRWRAQAACRDLEERYGLHQVGVSATARRHPTAPELHKARRLRRTETDRDVLRREARCAAAAAAGTDEFFALLREAGILTRPRMSSVRPHEVTGYSIALNRAHPIWYGGGRLATDLTLPRLRARWHDLPTTPPADPGNLVALAVRMAETAGLADTGASDLLFVAARQAPGRARRRILLRAADALDRAARPRRSPPARTHADLRGVARLLQLTGQLGDDRNSATVLQLLLALARLAEALADLKAAGRQLHQAREAREAARLLRMAAHIRGPAGTTRPLTPGRNRRHDPAAPDAPGRST